MKYQASGSPAAIVEKCRKALWSQGLVEPKAGEVEPWRLEISIVHQERPFEWMVLGANITLVSRSMKYEQVLGIIESTVATLGTPVK